MLTTEISVPAEIADVVQAMGDAMTTLLADPWVESDVAKAEGVRYLTRWLAQGSVLIMEADPAYPHLVAHCWPLGNFGMPCPDYLYAYAALDGSYSYRITGTRRTARRLTVEIYQPGYVDFSTMTVFASRHEFEVGSDGRVEITLSKVEQPGNWMQLPDGPCGVNVRQLLYDWDNEEPGEFSIERIGARYPSPPITPDELAKRRRRYVDFIRNGNAVMVQRTARQYVGPPNTLAFPQDPFAMSGQVYGLGHYRCGLDEAVILEVTPPECEYWSIALYSQFREISDWLLRPTTINGHQAFLDDDGAFRVVISHRDPGTPNWLDASHHELGLITLRYLNMTSVPEPVLRVLPFDDLASVFPPQTPVVSQEQRQQELARRTQILRRRYRP
jgi:hypothetical protein